MGAIVGIAVVIVVGFGLYELGNGMPDLNDNSGALEQAVNLIKGFEGFSPNAYADPPGQSDTFSIGYGHQMQPDDPHVISEADAAALLTKDVSNAMGCVTRAVVVPLTDKQRAALCSFAYNVGCSAFLRSTLLRLLNSGDYQGAADEFDRWTKAGGVVNMALVARRAQEAQLFLTGVSA